MTRSDLTVGGWLAVGLGAAALLLAAVVAAAVAGLAGIDSELRRQQDLVLPRVDAAEDLQVALLRLGIAARSHALSPSPARAQRLYATEGAVESALAALDALPKEPDGASAYAGVPALVGSYRERAHELAITPRTGVLEAENRLSEVREVLIPAIDGYVVLQERKLARSASEVLRRQRRAIWLLGAGTGGAVLSLALVAFLIGRGVRRPVLEFAGLAARVEAGDYAPAAALPAPVGGRAPRNELARLAGAFGAMARALRDREERIAAQNEELQAQNEELQSQHEELHAQQEELQSQQEELQAQNEELRVSEDALRDAGRRKDEFLAVLSHELRNPLAPIVNGLAILERAPGDSEGTRRARGIIARQVRQLVRLVDDLLDVTRIARGKAVLRRVDADVAGIVRHVVEDHRALLEEVGVRLELRLPAAPVPAHADPERLAQVVANLLQNAAKFTPRGGSVSVECALDGDSAVLRVVDDGEGIPPDLLARLFAPFVQADGSLARTRGGLGLGLALVKGLVELHGGTVAAASDGPGRGAEFTVVLPRRAPVGGTPGSPVVAAGPTGDT